MTKDQHKLEPCPFCGATANDGDGPVLRVGELGYHFVFCNGCGASGPENAFFQTDAIPAWNRRAHLQQRPLPEEDEASIPIQCKKCLAITNEGNGCELEGCPVGVTPPQAPSIDGLDKLRAALARLPRAKWTASKRNVEVPESEDLASCYVECHSNKDVGRLVARYIADANPAVVGALLDAFDAAYGVSAADNSPVKWTGADGTAHEISTDYAAQIAKWMFDKHGDVQQVDAVLTGVGGTDGR